jgi:hypothetical protein
VRISHNNKGLTEKAQGLKEEKSKRSSWRQENYSEEMASNWRLSPLDKDNARTRHNEYGLTMITNEPKEKGVFHGDVLQMNENSSLQTSVEARHFIENESRSVERGVQKGRVIQGGQQIGVRMGSGRGRGRYAWNNQVLNQDNMTQTSQTPKNTSANNMTTANHKQGRGRGVRRTPYHIASAGNRHTLNSEDISTSKKDDDSDVLKMENKVQSDKIGVNDGWIMVGSAGKKKTLDQKDCVNERTSTKSINDGNRFFGKSKEVSQSGDQSTSNSHPKFEKQQKQKDHFLKKERRKENTQKIQNDRKVIKSREVKITENNVLKTDKGRDVQGLGERNNDIESGRKYNIQNQEKESKKDVEIVRILKTEKSSNQKEMKLLLKRNSTLFKDEQITVRDTAFDFNQKEDFPDLAASNKSSSSLASDWLSGGSRMPIISYSAALKTIPQPKVSDICLLELMSECKYVNCIYLSILANLPYHSEGLTICRCNSKGSTFSSVILRP